MTAPSRNRESDIRPNTQQGWWDIRRRVVVAEHLDTMNPDEPMAIGSRRDLRRLNRIMGNARLLTRIFTQHVWARWVTSIVELGAGDGNISEAIAVQWPRTSPPPSLILVDQHTLLPAARQQRLERLGWRVQTHTMDVFAWLSREPEREGRLIFANLFLHHFSNDRLSQLLTAALAHSELFVACEPRRSYLSLAASSLVGLIGCNAVTRHDGVASVRAGFRKRELSARQGSAPNSETNEGPAGLFSHYFWSRDKPDPSRRDAR